MNVDLHQHLWTAPLIEALAARNALPYAEVHGDTAVLHAAGERPSALDLSSETAERRAALLDHDGVDLAVIALSSPIGIEALPRDEARSLIDAHLEGVAQLGARFAAWGPLALDQPEPDDVDELLARGCIGVSLPAGALDTPTRVAALGPVLERIAYRDVPLFVHPGPGLNRANAAEADRAEPPWWAAVTGYVAQMQAAWFALSTAGRRDHPGLTILFSMLAGGAPLLSERLATRGGPDINLRDPLTYYDTSSYGPAAVEATARRIGTSRLVYGSDRPVLEPLPTGRETMLLSTAAELLTPVRLAA